MPDPIHVKSIVNGVSECDPIELLVSPDQTRRLVFLPVIHNNPNKNGNVTGCFVYQRKKRADDWERIINQAESLTKLKAGEGYKLDLPTDAVTKLVDGLMDIQEISESVNHGKTNTTFVPSAQELVPVLEQLMGTLDNDALLKELLKLSRDKALRLNDLVLSARIRSALKYWDDNKNDSVEENWQKFFNARPWILALICSEPIIVYKAKMYTGGANASGSGGKNVDYGLINQQTRNTALLEIKTPLTPLLAKEYRTIYPPSHELAGSVTQVQNYKHNLLVNILALRQGAEPFEAVDVSTYVVVGNTEQLKDDMQVRSYELYRHGLANTVVLTYDEVFERLRILLDESKSASSAAGT